MLKAILKFVTPGRSLTLPSGFSWRVVTSWITCGWVLGIIGALISIFQPSSGAEVSNIIFVVVVGLPFALCFYGFLGLAVDLTRGNKLVYSGWYWYAYPLITAFWIVIWIFVSIFILLAPLMGVKISPKQRQPKFNPEQFRREVENMKVEEVLEEFDKQFEQVERKNQLDQEENKVIKKLKKIRVLDHSALSSQLRDALTDEELETFFDLLLKIFSGEIG
jgi:hypothetical protein